MSLTGSLPIATSFACVQVDPTKRPTAAEALQHPWLQHQQYRGSNEH
jgi:serine/threonine protein kinase